ncbi:DsrE/DsrF/TusD sulfur relay family protein [Ottowia sp.]|uniref:DsrE/DsrF/TusD sulfur relay family protein n=1 Tax=Ottowia sp. TaxID=1898956 RepID=UPI003A8BA24D
MQKILIIIHAPPYGSERCLSALRLAAALAGREGKKPLLDVFLMSDATVLGLPGQQDASGNTLQMMVEEIISHGVPVRVCKTCAGNRGLLGLSLIEGVTIGTLAELAEATVQADKVITF